MPATAENDAPETLDATGLACPLPVLRARKRLKGLAPGSRLRVLATDPAAPKDFAAFAATGAARLLDITHDDATAVILLQKP